MRGLLRRLTPRGVWLAIRKRVSRFGHLQRSGRVIMGRGSYGAPNVVTFAGDESTSLRVGKYSSIASTATFLLGGNHPLDRVTTYPLRRRFGLPTDEPDGYPSSKGDIEVGNDVWIAHEALILSGVTIGDGAVVAARAVVTRDVAPYAIVAGNPARVVGSRKGRDLAASVHAARWWDWPDARIVAHIDDLTGPSGGMVTEHRERT